MWHFIKVSRLAMCASFKFLLHVMLLRLQRQTALKKLVLILFLWRLARLFSELEQCLYCLAFYSLPSTGKVILLAIRVISICSHSS